MTGVEITSLRVLGQTESLGLVSNSQSFFPVVVSYPRIQPSPCAEITWSTPPMVPTVGVDHWPWRIRFSTELSSHTSLPVVLLSAMIAGAFGEGMFTWLSSWPFDVLTKSRSPQTTGDEFARL